MIKGDTVSEEQEMSMNEILSSIRQILSDDVPSDAESLDDSMEDIFVLTPAMRYKEGTQTSIQEKMKMVLNKLAEQKAVMPAVEYHQLVINEVRPILTDWMNQHLPTLIENAVNQEIKKLLD